MTLPAGCCRPVATVWVVSYRWSLLFTQIWWRPQTQLEQTCPQWLKKTTQVRSFKTISAPWSCAMSGSAVGDRDSTGMEVWSKLLQAEGNAAAWLHALIPLLPSVDRRRHAESPGWDGDSSDAPGGGGGGEREPGRPQWGEGVQPPRSSTGPQESAGPREES